MLTLLVVNTLIIQRLIRYHKNHRRLLNTSHRTFASVKSNHAYSRRHHRTTIMLIAVVVSFLVCRCPMLLTQMFEFKYSSEKNHYVQDRGYFRCRIQRTLGTWARFLQTVNANGNVIIYLFFCQKFRKISKTVIQNFLSKRKGDPNRHILSTLPQRPRVNTQSRNM